MFVGKFYHISFALVLLLYYYMACLVSPSSNFTDQSTLILLKAHMTYDPNNILDYNWTTATSFCNWIGVTCSHHQQRVTGLNLPNMGLGGTIAPHVGNLTFLIYFNISNNNFHGQMPNELGYLHQLEFIDMRFNELSGEVSTWLGFLPRLRHLLLFGNNLTGTIPCSLGNITKLERLFLGRNSLQGEIPRNIGNLRNLKRLGLSENHLLGSIPATIFNISSLQRVFLFNNNLYGTLPGNMCNHHPKLEVLHLSQNQFSGQIPYSLYKCAELQELLLFSNKFTGSLPREIRNLSLLRVLNLGRNNLTDTIPPSISNISMLEVLEISENNIYGNIPKELGHLPRLRKLMCNSDNIIGEIPQAILNISTLEIISLVNNHLSGHLPSSTSIWFPNLEFLHLGLNKLVGMIPASISNASKLNTLDLSGNFFSGLVPSTLGNLKYLQVLNLAENQLTNEPSASKLTFFTSLTNCRHLRILWIASNPLNGILPDSIGNLSTSIENFDVCCSGIKGVIPSGIGNLSNLITFGLWDNDLIGSVPTTIGRLNKLQRLYLGRNRIQGSIPTELCQLGHLGDLRLRENRLSGSIPNCVGNLSSLRKIFLSYNSLTSRIPLTIWSLKDLLVFNLSSNSLVGHLPLEIGYLQVLIEMDLSANQLSGNIPSTMGNLRALKNVSLSRNRLQGLIPQSFGRMISLESLDLSHNNLSGGIPKTLEALSSLKYLNVSFNRLQGEVPDRGPFVNFTVQSFMGNDGLCGVSRLQVSPCVVVRSQSGATLLILKYVLPTVVPIIFVVAFISLLLMQRRQWRKFPTQAIQAIQTARADLLPTTTHRRIPYQELLHATGNFDESNLLGIGSFSSVYKGVLFDGTMAAIKVFNLEFQGASKSFDVECEIMRNICHRNLAKIISSCSNLEFRALVLEYMPNGSLEKWLYSHKYNLDIIQRLDVMIDVASALEYLHHGYSTSVVHCDLKPSNVLLDENMVGHVSDFGIAKILAENESTRQTITLGTLGYVAPEYGLEGRISTGGDVYSYGIMLMETFTRKKPTDEMFVGELNLNHWVNKSLPDAVMEVADDNLFGSEEEDFMAKKHCVSSIMRLAVECSVESSKDRIKMNDAVVRLKKIKLEYLSNVKSFLARGTHGLLYEPSKVGLKISVGGS